MLQAFVPGGEDAYESTAERLAALIAGSTAAGPRGRHGHRRGPRDPRRRAPRGARVAARGCAGPGAARRRPRRPASLAHRRDPPAERRGRRRRRRRPRARGRASGRRAGDHRALLALRGRRHGPARDAHPRRPPPRPGADRRRRVSRDRLRGRAAAADRGPSPPRLPAARRGLDAAVARPRRAERPSPRRGTGGGRIERPGLDVEAWLERARERFLAAYAVTPRADRRPDRRRPRPPRRVRGRQGGLRVRVRRDGAADVAVGAARRDALAARQEEDPRDRGRATRGRAPAGGRGRGSSRDPARGHPGRARRAGRRPRPARARRRRAAGRGLRSPALAPDRHGQLEIRRPRRRGAPAGRRPGRRGRAGLRLVAERAARRHRGRPDLELGEHPGGAGGRRTASRRFVRDRVDRRSLRAAGEPRRRGHAAGRRTRRSGRDRDPLLSVDGRGPGDARRSRRRQVARCRAPGRGAGARGPARRPRCVAVGRGRRARRGSRGPRARRRGADRPGRAGGADAAGGAADRGVRVRHRRLAPRRPVHAAPRRPGAPVRRGGGRRRGDGDGHLEGRPRGGRSGRR